MSLIITNDIIKEIAEYLDSGMICHYHIPTGELAYFPDELKAHADLDKELWQETIDKVDSNYQEYIHFEGMDSHESFRLMENFVVDITDPNIRQRFENAIGYRMPFQNFKQLLYNYPELRQQWFDYKTSKYMEWVREQLKNYNQHNSENNGLR